MSRIRANQITNQAADGAPTVQHGLIIAGVSTFTGSVSIGGTLTYEDVTNIDSVGIVTAGQGVRVPDGSASSNYISVGNSQDLKLYHDSNHSYIRDTGTGGLRITTDSFNLLNSNNNESMITATEDGAVKLYYNHNLRLETESSRTLFRGASGIGVYGNAGANDNGQITIHPTGSAVYTNLFFYNAAGNSYASIIGHEGQTLFFDSGTNGPLRFRVNGTGFHSFQDGNTQRVVIPSAGGIELKTDGKGIQFPTTQTPHQSDTNRAGISSEMRYYETGTFVPGLSSTVLNSLQNPVFTDGSYARRIGRYVRVGHLVFCTVEIKMASSITFAGGAHTGIAPVSIVGVVPFKYAYAGRYAASGEPDYNPCNIWYNGSGLTDDTLYATLQRHFPGQAQIQITKPDTGGVDKYNSTNYGEVFPADSHVVVSYTYAIDSDNNDY